MNLSAHQGLTYRLPTRWFVATLTVSGESRTVALSKTVAFGDPSTLYVARIPTNQFSTNTVSIGVNENGLLEDKLSAEITSKLPDILGALATSAGNAETLERAEPEDEKLAEQTLQCSQDGTYTWVFDPVNPTAIESSTSSAAECGVEWHVSNAENAPTGQSAAYEEGSRAGFYYRQAVPYVVRLTVDTGTAGKVSQTYLESLPTSQSPTAFLPLQRTAFARSKAEITFKEGVPTKVGHDQDSEWLAIAKIPATIIGNYVAGIKSGFESRKGAAIAEKEYLSAMSAALAQQAKTNSCLAELAKPTPDAMLVGQLCQ
jgi:hypothetical protein